MPQDPNMLFYVNSRNTKPEERKKRLASVYSFILSWPQPQDGEANAILFADLVTSGSS